MKLANRDKSKKVLIIDTGEVFKSCRYAAEKYGTSMDNISNCARGKSKNACGHYWKYL